MPVSQRTIPNTYRDSVSLMQVSARIAALAGIRNASVVMATQGNIDLLREAKLIDETLSASPSDLLLVVDAETDDALAAALVACEEALVAQAPAARQSQKMSPRSLRMGVEEVPGANLALVSAPGDYAAAEALKALYLGLNVMLFSDNVSVEDELVLKREAAQRGLLVMGPDCGTAIIHGVPLGFANVVRRGAVGVVGASGTGMQQVTCLLDAAGVGVSQALGTGGRDLREEIGGLTMLQALEEFGEDANTQVVLLVSKPPAPTVAARVLQRASTLGKPVVACFLGAMAADVERANVYAAGTLAEAANMASELARGARPSRFSAALPTLPPMRFAKVQRYVRALYSGGTFCYEATLLLARELEDVYSNTPVGGALPLADVWRATAHTLVDLGDDEFTRGRPHPMIDHRLRNERLLREAQDPQVRVILFDIVLGYGAHADPAAEMLPAINAAQRFARERGTSLALIAFVCGTVGDPQGMSRQQAALREAGVILGASNAQAVRMAAEYAHV